MKKSNVILQAAIASALLAMTAGAYAGNMATTTRSFATENFGATQTATVAITPAAVSYSISSPGGVTLAPAQTFTVYFRLSGTHKFAAIPLAAQFSTLPIGLLATSVPPTSVSWTAGATAGTFAVTYTSANAAALNLPQNTTVIWTPLPSAVTATSSILAVAGGAISVTGSASGLAANTAATTLPADQDPISTAVNIALSAAAITGAVQSSAAFSGTGLVAETKKIDLGASNGVSAAFAPVTTNTTVPNIVNLGAYTYTNNATVIPTTLQGAVNYALGAAAAAAGALFAGTTATVAPGAGQSFPIGATFNLSSAVNCTTLTSAASTAITAATAATAVAIPATGTNAVPGTALPYYVCMVVPAAAPFSTIAPVSPTVAVALNKTVTTDAPDNIVATAVYPLAYNGTQLDVRSYIPAVTVGYQSFVRLINNGAVSAAVNGQWLYEDGTVGVSAPLTTVANGGATLASGGSRTLTSAQVEAAIGAPTVIGGNRPRLRLTAPTTAMNAQSFFLTTANGNFSDVTGAQ